MENAKKKFVMCLPHETKEEFLRNCYLEVAKKAATADIVSNVQISGPIEMCTVAVRHDISLDVNYTANIGYDRVERSVVKETHNHEDGYSYTDEVVREVKHVDWEPYQGHEKNLTMSYIVPLSQIDNSPFIEEGKQKGNPYWKEKQWTKIDPSAWIPASAKYAEKLSKVQLQTEIYSKNAIAETGFSKITKKLPGDRWSDFTEEHKITDVLTTVGVQIDYRVVGAYKGQKFHIPPVGKEILPIPTRTGAPNAAPKSIGLDNVEIRQKRLLHEHQNYRANKKKAEKLLLAMAASIVLGFIFGVIWGKIIFFPIGIAAAIGLWFLRKNTARVCSEIEHAMYIQAQEDYEKAQIEAKIASESYEKAYLELCQKKIDALNAVFTKLGMPTLNDKELASLHQESSL